MKIKLPSHLSDDALLSSVKRLATGERDMTVDLVAHLAELDVRQLYLRDGYSSLYVYCREVIGLSEDAAYNRMAAAKAARAFPVILDMLASGALNLTSVRMLRKHLTPENHQELLAAASGKGNREVEELIARYFPQPDVPDTLRRLPPSRTALLVARLLPAASGAEVPASPSPAATFSARVVQAVVASADRRSRVAPLAPDRFAFSFTGKEGMRDRYLCARDLLRHAIPEGDMAEIFDRALIALLEDVARKRFAKTDRPRRSRGSAPGSRPVPARVKRKVFVRDLASCAFIGKGGRRCGERAFIEFHHLDPHGVGGEPTVDNVELRCRAHNVYESEVFYGPRKAGEWAVREPAARYVSSTHETRFGTGTKVATRTARPRVYAMQKHILLERGAAP